MEGLFKWFDGKGEGDVGGGGGGGGLRDEKFWTLFSAFLAQNFSSILLRVIFYLC